MAFRVHRAERADLLVEELAALLRVPPADPFARDLVIVPARGVERWLSQRLSHLVGNAAGHTDGVCAAVDFATPSSLISDLLGTRERDPWSPEEMAWPLLRALDAAMDQPWAAVLARHLGHGESGAEAELRRGRRLAVSRRLAGIFAAYAAERPVVLAHWEDGVDDDGAGGPLPDDLRWQPPLWRETLAQSGVPSPSRRHAAIAAALRDGSLEPALPPRLSLFGHTRIGPTEADLLAALGQRREVHLWLPHPSDAMWQRLREHRGDGPRSADTSHLLATHPLLASMGRDLREGEATLLAAGAVDAGAPPTPQRPDTVLGRVQQQISADQAPTPGDLVDDSVQVHACHGPARQVEVLREVVLGLLADDPTLQPRDIVVMCPDIDEYAPLISGAFGLGDVVAGSHPGHRLRVMLADRSPMQTNPLLGVLSAVLDLADGRAEASRVLDLLASDPVRRRFRFTDSDLEIITGWVTSAGVRWAWDAEGRARFGLSAYPQNTWRFGIDRVLAGVALSDDSQLWLGPTLPLDDVSTTDIGLAGRLAEVIDRLEELTSRMRDVHDLAAWATLIADGVERIAATPKGEEWQFAQLRRELALVHAGGGDLELRLADIRALLDRQLAGRPTRASFRTGSLTVCTMTPMRSVPHRVVCLLGLDDGVFPRGGRPDGDDLLGRAPRVGERDRRSEDRQLFLDAIMAATERLVITYTGFSEASGAPRPPSVPLREFLDVVHRTTAGVVEHQHKSQAFHPAYLGAAPPAADPEPSRPLPRSFDPDAERAARAAAARAQRTAAGEATTPLTLADLRPGPEPPQDIDLDDVVRAVVTPVTAFLRGRLQIDLPREEDEVSDAIPVDLGGLARWQVGERILQELRAGRPVAEVMEAEWRRGTMPPGRFGWRRVGEIVSAAGPLVDQFAASTQGLDPRALDIDVALGGGRRLTGTVTDVYDQRLVRVGFSRLTAQKRLESWVRLVALSADRPGAWVARVIGRSGGDDAPVRATYGAVAEPAQVLAGLVTFHDDARSRVLPFAAETARCYARTAGSERPAWLVDKELGECWRDDNRGVDLITAWGHRPTWAEATAEPARSEGFPHLFAELATSVWASALRAEVE